ncbi:MAG: hypothetical protein LC664_13390 [Flavobacteriales bacterium]|nr:hypothetical protein [Flavobacteriales bacterium]
MINCFQVTAFNILVGHLNKLRTVLFEKINLLLYGLGNFVEMDKADY